VPKSILITGATSGIGRALAHLYAERGITLALTGRDIGRLAEVAAECERRGATVISESIDVLDVGRLALWIESIDDRHPVDLIIANAGIASGIGFGRPRESLEAISRVLSTNILGMVNTVTPMVPRMTARACGHIAIVGSLAGYRGMPYSPAYCASKAAVGVYAEGLRGNLMGAGVDVTLVVPGFIATPMNERSIFPRPLEYKVEKAARIIRRGLDKRAKLIAFPRLLYLGARLLAFLPGYLVDRVMCRIEVDIPE
jgi:short-subunit dehydrogenase